MNRDPNDQAEIDRDREETDLPTEDFDERGDREYINSWQNFNLSWINVESKNYN